MTNTGDREDRRMKETTKMKPCPFCGGEAKLEHYEGDGYLPMCSVEGCCGMVEIWFDTPEKAIEAWNRRVKDD